MNRLSSLKNLMMLLAKGRQEGIQIGHEKGREEGEKQAKIAVARKMLTDKMDTNTIAKFTGLSINEIAKLQKDDDLFLS